MMFREVKLGLSDQNTLLLLAISYFSVYSQLFLQPSYSRQLPLGKIYYYGRDFIPYCILTLLHVLMQVKTRTAITWGPTGHISTTDLQSQRAMVTINTHATGQRQRALGSKVNSGNK